MLSSLFPLCLISHHFLFCVFLVCAGLFLVAQSCLTLCDPMDCISPGSSGQGDSPGKNTGVSCHALFKGIFPTQGSNPGLLHCRQILYQLSYQRSPLFVIRRSQDWGKRKKLVFLPVNEGIQLCQIHIGLRITWRQGKYIGKVLEMLIVRQIHRLT